MKISNFFQKIKQGILYNGLTREEYLQTKDSVAITNRSHLIAESIFLMSFWVLSLILALRDEAFYNCRYVYIAGLISCVICLLISLFAAKQFPQIIFPTVLFFEISMLAAGVGIAVFQPTVRSITMTAFALFVPMCMITPMIWSLALQLSTFIVYVIVARGIIVEDIYVWGILTLAIFSTGGLMVGYVSNKGHFKRFLHENTIKKMSEFQAWSESKILFALKKALRDHRLTVFYQPIYSLNTKKFDSAEALVRLNDPTLGMVSPEVFIPLAEKNGLIIEIGDFVFEEVCSLFARHRGDIHFFEHVSINLSALQCADKGLPDRWKALMEKYDVKQDKLVLEVTESVMSSSIEGISDVISALIDVGFSFALDDYGTGYANDSLLVEFPFKFIKIDKKILWSADKSENGNKLLQHFISMCHDLKMRIVVEGVETQNHRDKLSSAGVEYLQGFLFSKPVEEDEAVSLIN